MPPSCATPPERVALRRCRAGLGTYVEVAVEAGCGGAHAEPTALRAIETAFAAIARVEATMSFHRADSALSRLNAAPGGATLALDRGLVAVLRLALAVHEASDGLFDPGVGAELERRGRLPRHGAAAPAGSSIADLELLDDTHVRVRRPLRLDLGGIAKGHAVDCAVEALAQAGISQAVVNAGGDLRVLGAPRPVWARHPQVPGGLVALGELGDGALATTAASFVEDGDDGPLVHPRTRAPARVAGSVSVIAPTCAAADALTKVLALAGTLPPACAARFEAHGLVA